MSYRPNYHLSPPQGRLNDPNGLFVDGETLHVFYQHDPCFPHAPKRTGWGHASASLTTAERWRHHPDALYPDMPYDKHGCYSGGAAVDDGDVWLFYTGNLKVDGRRIPSQNRVRALASSGPEGGIYLRDPANPLIPDTEPGFTGHFRDPQIVREADGWRMAIGAQDEDEKGTVVLYRSADLVNWRFEGPLQFDLTGAKRGLSPDILPGGYMWECPNLVTMTDEDTAVEKQVLVFCPQGLDPVDVDGQTHYASSDQCGYLVGTLDGTTFHVERGFSELDYGFEFYAPQLIETGTGDAIMLGWVGLPAQDDKPTVADGWVHSLTLPRRVSLYDGTLRQQPMWENLSDIAGGSNTPVREGYGNVVVAEAEGEGTWELVDQADCVAFKVEFREGILRLDRGGEQRRIACPNGNLFLVADGCVVEVYAGNGAIAASQSVFATPVHRWKSWVQLSS